MRRRAVILLHLLLQRQRDGEVPRHCIVNILKSKEKHFLSGLRLNQFLRDIIPEPLPGEPIQYPLTKRVCSYNGVEGVFCTIQSQSVPLDTAQSLL